MRRIAFAPLLILCMLIVIGMAGCKGSAPSGPGGMAGSMPPPDVGVITAKPTVVSLQQDLVGRLSAIRSADVRARVPGVLEKRVYVEGSDVREGQVLFRIDAASLQASLEQGQASLASAQATYANARAAADRARQLIGQRYISKSDYDNALAAERSAAAAVQQGKASADSARINLGYATVRSPIAGRAGKQQVTEGALVGQGEATLLTTVDQIDSMYVNFTMSIIDQEQLQRLRGGAASQDDVEILLPDGTPYEHKGTLDFSGNSVDPATGAVAMRGVIPNPDRRLLPGMYVTLKLTMGNVKGAFLIPQAAIQRDQASAYALVVGSGGNVVRKDVDANRSQGSDWMITKGLESGDQVIVSGLQKAQAGKPAKPSPWQPDGETAPAASAPKG